MCIQKKGVSEGGKPHPKGGQMRPRRFAVQRDDQALRHSVQIVQEEGYLQVPRQCRDARSRVAIGDLEAQWLGSGHANAIAALALGLVQRGICLLEQQLGTGIGTGQKVGCADADGQVRRSG